MPSYGPRKRSPLKWMRWAGRIGDPDFGLPGDLRCEARLQGCQGDRDRRVGRRVPPGTRQPTIRRASDIASRPSQARVPNSREFSGRPMRGNSRIEGTRPVRSGLPHRQAVRPISTGRRRGQVLSLVSGALLESGATRDAREARKEPHYRSRSRLSISGGSVGAAREGRRLHLNRESTL